MARDAQEIMREIDTKLIFFMDMLKRPVMAEELIIYIGNNDYEIMGDYAQEYMLCDPHFVRGVFNSYKGIHIVIAPHLEDIQVGVKLLMPDKLIEEA
ncbi:MAG: hypothetical protein J6S67_11790 [Methanobrevibacter sp.]|nr:hypothetical protein [Methanobrevibacter sp.]